MRDASRIVAWLTSEATRLRITPPKHGPDALTDDDRIDAVLLLKHLDAWYPRSQARTEGMRYLRRPGCLPLKWWYKVLPFALTREQAVAPGRLSTTERERRAALLWDGSLPRGP